MKEEKELIRGENMPGRVKKHGQKHSDKKETGVYLET